MGNVQLYGQTEKKMKFWYKNESFFHLDQFQYNMVDIKTIGVESCIVVTK